MRLTALICTDEDFLERGDRWRSTVDGVRVVRHGRARQVFTAEGRDLLQQQPTLRWAFWLKGNPNRPRHRFSPRGSDSNWLYCGCSALQPRRHGREVDNRADTQEHKTPKETHCQRQPLPSVLAPTMIPWGLTSQWMKQSFLSTSTQTQFPLGRL